MDDGLAGENLASPGVDVTWPTGANQQYDEFAWRLNEALSKKGWSLIQMPSNDDALQGVLAQAEQLPYESPKKEFAADILGTDGSGKICYLQQGPESAFFSSYDDRITDFCNLIQPWSWQTMGFRVSGRSQGMVWTPYASRREEQAMKPLDLDEDDVEEGLIESHLDFIQRRRLCCLYVIGTEGGTISLYGKGESAAKVEFDVSADQLLVFRCDEMTFQHDPDGEFTIYSTWVMDDPPERNMQGVVADPAQKMALQGLVKGVNLPQGDRVCIKATNCCVGGSANSTLENWNMYVAGTDGFVYVPHSRFDTDIYFAKEGEEFSPGVNSYHKHGGLCDDEKLMCFDHEFFDITGSEAPFVWPKQRMVLEEGYVLLVEAGFTRKSLNRRNISVIMGDCNGDWFGNVGSMAPEIFPNLFAGYSMSITAGRLSFVFGMAGHTASIDTACSSGLVAFAVGSTAMRSGRNDQFQSFASGSDPEGFVTGGILANTGPSVWIGNSGGGMLSHEGRCFTFDTSADGYARGEGTSLVYSQLMQDGLEKDEAVAVCIGAVTNQDGRSATLTAPNGPAQTACTRASLKEGGITPGEVSASECHGTGTALGDPIEIGALIGVHGADRTNGSSFGLTSSKSNIGHGEDNAGACGLFKCILMAKYSTGTTNCHLRSMNSNLVHDGFPALFMTENCDANLNAAISGVSSFGFGGANAHAEFWAKSSYGMHALHPTPLVAYDQLTVTCPVTMGQIDYLTGEPAVDFETYAPMRVKANVLREPLADYGVSRHAYDGKFRFRASEEDEADEENHPMDLPTGTSIYVCGTWSGWSKFEEMEMTDDGVFATTIALGNTRCEHFFLCMNGDIDSRIYPVVTDASPLISIRGPSNSGEGKCWIIDGRDKEVPAGTTYQIYFKWGRIMKKVWWEEAPEAIKPTTHEHVYSFLGSWTSYQFQDLTPTADPNVFEGSFKMNERGECLFQLVRDHDYQQLIYPSKPDTDSTDVPVRGPDAWGAGKYWKVEGAADEIVEVNLEIDDGNLEVTIGLQVWESAPTWNRHDYFLKLMSSEGAPLMMVEPGIFQCVATVSGTYSKEHEAYVESFQILVDEDPLHCFYPELPDSASGVNITCPPDGQEHAEHWMIRSLWPGVRFQVTFNPSAIDRRKMVTWKLL